jgi:glycosyltransferase involved in cell wall biosynthesis
MYQATKRLAVDGKVDMVIGVSQFVINKLKELRLFKNATTVTLPNAIELNKQSPVERNSETVNIVYTGVISKHKGVGVLVDAFKQLKQSNVHLHIVGDGGQTAELKKTSGGDGRIKFHGFVSLKGLAELQEIMDIAVVPSVWYEPLPKVIVESFKHGVPVVASNIGGIPEIIENGNNGLLFEAGNATQLKDKLEQLIENPAERKRLGQGAYQSVRKYDINIVIGQLQQIYEQVKGQI